MSDKFDLLADAYCLFVSKTAPQFSDCRIYGKPMSEYMADAMRFYDTKFIQERDELVEAAKELYSFAYWHTDVRRKDEAERLWKRLRNALGLPEGTATAAGAGAKSSDKERSDRCTWKQENLVLRAADGGTNPLQIEIFFKTTCGALMVSNMYASRHHDTYCPHCGRIIIER